MKKIEIYEATVKVYLLENIKLDECPEEISSIVDMSFLESEKYKDFHEKGGFKNYSVGGFTPVERDRTFKKGNIYEFKVRTPDKGLNEYLVRELFKIYTKKIKVLVVESRVIPRNLLEKIYTLTPAIAKFQDGYWKNNVGVEEYEKRIIENLIKKYNSFTGLKIDEGFNLYERIEFNNDYPIPVKYKGIKLLGDKVTLYLDISEEAQELAYFSLGVGLLEMSPRMYGFLGYKYL